MEHILPHVGPAEQCGGHCQGQRPRAARRRSELSVRESDLRHHLVNEASLDDKKLENDRQADPRFKLTADELKAKGIKDFQLYYALQTLRRTTLAVKRK